MVRGWSGARRGLRIGAILTAVSIISACSQVTYGTGVNTTLQTVRDFTGILVPVGMGREQIVYEERPNLVTPPTNAVPPPGGTAAATVTAPTTVTPAPCQLWDYEWIQLSDGVRTALTRLGWSDGSWRSPQPEAWPPSAGTSWDGLRFRERQAAETLGFTQASWETCGLP